MTKLSLRVFHSRSADEFWIGKKRVVLLRSYEDARDICCQRFFDKYVGRDYHKMFVCVKIYIDYIENVEEAAQVSHCEH